MIYLVDFENVTSAGISGIQKLTKNDKVYIFYTVNASTLSFAAHLNLLSSPAEIIYYNVASGGKNALDFQLSSFLGYLISQGSEKDFCIISNDKGYEYVKGFWERNGLTSGVTIHSAPSINRSLLPSERPFTAKIQQGAKEQEQPEQEESIPAVNKFPEPAAVTAREEKETAEAEEKPAVQAAAEEKPVVESPAENTEKKAAETAAAEETAAEDPPAKKRGRPKGKKTAAAVTDADTAATPASLSLDLLIEKASIPAGDKEKKEIMALLEQAGGRQHFYRGLLSIFGMEKGVEVYKILRPEYTNLTKLAKQ